MEENNYGADITELKTRMTNAEKNIDRHENLINELDDKSANNRSEIASLNITIAKLNGNIDLMRQEIVGSNKELKQEIASSNKELSNTYKELSTKMESLFEKVNNTIEKSEIKRNDLEEKVDKIEKENEDRKKEELEDRKFNRNQIKNIIFKCLGTIAVALVSAALVYFGLQ